MSKDDLKALLFMLHHTTFRYAHPEIPRFIINPGEAYDPYDDHFPDGYEHIKENATTGVETFIDRIIYLT